ncbi:MAG: hypothetical protein ACFFG0_17380 [Candidatus Thorarchaeota archaeon]
MEFCRKDFGIFKKDNGNKICKLLIEKILHFTELGMDLTLINNQKDNMERIRKFIKEGKEDIAFSLFFISFLTSLPHRSRL